MPSSGTELSVGLVLASLVVEWCGRARPETSGSVLLCGRRKGARRQSAPATAVCSERSSFVTIDRRDVITSIEFQVQEHLHICMANWLIPFVSG
jgi:hypothetical protein